jgi:hypothetical protein
VLQTIETEENTAANIKKSNAFSGVRWNNLRNAHLKCSQA